MKKLALKSILLITLFFFNATCFSQTVVEEEEESTQPKSILSTIILNGTSLEHQMNNKDVSKKDKIKIADSVLQNYNDFYPPILFAASRVMYDEANRPADASFLMYLAQVKTKLDVRLNADSTVIKTYISLGKVYSVSINNYSRSNRDSAIAIVQRVLDAVDKNIGNYDHRWLSFHSSKIVRTKDKSTLTEADLIKPKEAWTAIKNATLNNYYSTFMEYITAKDLDKY